MTAAVAEGVVGPIGTTDAENAASLSEAGEGYDFAIGGLGFRMAISDERPYERSTAPFRKEQLDTSQEVGDQSLIGWWTRGQLSFHRGAGITYYDLEDAEVTRERFTSSEGVNPFTPGEVVCNPGWVEDQAFTDLTWGGAGDGIDAVVDGGTLHYRKPGGPWTAYVPSPAAQVVAATLGATSIYFALDDGRIIRLAYSSLLDAFSETTIYDHSTKGEIVGLWYAKDRLWVIDGVGDFYQTAPAGTGVAIDAANKVFTVTDSWGEDWAFTPTPGPVLVANGNRVFGITVASDGTVPTTSAPAQVAELPNGEVVRGMTHTLGFVVLATTKGIRVAVTSDSGQLTYGPLLTEWDDLATETTIARAGSSAYVVAQDKVYEVNLARQVGDGLEFGWTVHSPLSGGVGSYATANSMYVYGAGLFFTTPSAPVAGTLRTAFHRFGTLEPKKFHVTKVRIGGSGGTVAVGRVNAAGVVLPLYTMDAAQTDGEDITLQMDAPEEMVGLEFTLTPSGSNSPVLLGYQIRALPAPTRQRLIRVPLMLHDVERRGTTRAKGHRDSAYERLAALEAMEKTGGTFTFQDFRTGESGQCFIEKIEHMGTTPPARQNDGFGGIVYATIRKL